MVQKRTIAFRVRLDRKWFGYREKRLGKEVRDERNLGFGFGFDNFGGFGFDIFKILGFGFGFEHFGFGFGFEKLVLVSVLVSTFDGLWFQSGFEQ